MKIVRVARTKLVEKDIEWAQTYTDKTTFLKEQYEDVIGSGSYFRFEGKDKGSGDEYYCIIGPAKVHQPKAKWFAGVRKLPATFSAGGKYFDSLDSAAKYARETWGVTTPKTLKPYTSAALFGISKKITEWKKKREALEEGGQDTQEDTQENTQEDTQKESFTNIINKTAAGYNELPSKYKGHSPRAAIYQPNTKFNIDKMIDTETGEVIEGSPEYKALVDSVVEDPSFKSISPNPDEIVTKKRSIEVMIQKAYNEKQRKVDDIAAFYGVPRNVASGMEHIFVSYLPGNERDSGLTITGVGPYVSIGERYGKSNVRKDAWGKFNVYYLKKRNASEAEVLSTADNQLKNINEKYGLAGTPNELTKSDLSYTIGGYGNKLNERTKINSLGPDSQEEMDQLFRISPIEGDGARMSVNNMGMAKIIRTIADKQGIGLEEALQTYSDQVKSDTSIATGAQNFTEAKRDDAALRDLETVQKVLGAIPRQMGNVRLMKSNIGQYRDLIRKRLTETDMMLSDREIDKAISEIIQMQASTKTRPERNTLELFEDNRKAIETAFDQTSYNTEQEAFEKANVTRDQIEAKDFQTEIPIADSVDSSVAQGLQADRLKILRTIRILQDLKEDGVIDIDVPPISDEQKQKLLTMSPKAYQLNRKMFQVFEDLMNDPEIQKFVEGPGVENVHKIDKSTPALEGVGDVSLQESDNYVEEVIDDIGMKSSIEMESGQRGEQIGEVGINTPERVTPKKQTKTPGYKSKKQRLQEELGDLPSRREVDEWYTDASRKPNNLKEVYASSLKCLISIARDMDNKGKRTAAEEIHKIIRKYKRREA